jgi:hypothetical protein
MKIFPYIVHAGGEYGVPFRKADWMFRPRWCLLIALPSPPVQINIQEDAVQKG